MHLYSESSVNLKSLCFLGRAGPKVVKGEKKVRCDSLLLCRPLSGVQQANNVPRVKRLLQARFSMPSWLLQALEAVPSFKYTRSGFLRAMSDAGLKPTVVYHNLTPAELYEKVRRLVQGFKALSPAVHRLY